MVVGIAALLGGTALFAWLKGRQARPQDTLSQNIEDITKWLVVGIVIILILRMVAGTKVMRRM